MSDVKPQLEHMKFEDQRQVYNKGLKEILSMNLPPAEIIHHFPAFAGPLTLARYLSLYEAYKMTVGLAGHIAEVGVALGAGSLFFAKLTKLFEPNTLTLVHGFDWFQGAKPTAEEKFVKEGECQVDEATVRRLIRAQGLEHTVHLHNLNVVTGLKGFLETNNHIQFKLVFLDCGVFDVVAASIREFWPRMTVGGVLIVDHYSHEFAPGETRALRELLPNAKFRQFPFGWMPVAYTVKE